MSSLAHGSDPQAKPGQIKLRAYVAGYILSVFLTITAYLIITNHLGGKVVLVALVVGLALAQFLVQLFFFLDLGREMGPRWKLLVFLCMTLVVSILVFGSLWIMANLNYRMSPQQINTYMNNQQGF